MIGNQNSMHGKVTPVHVVRELVCSNCYNCYKYHYATTSTVFLLLNLPLLLYYYHVPTINDNHNSMHIKRNTIVHVVRK